VVFFIKHILAFLLLIPFSFGFSQVPNYEKTENWAVLPGAYPSGLIEYHKGSSLFSKVDIFYVYPTVFLSKKDKRWNIPLDDAYHKRKIIDLAVRFQASAWVEAGRIFVPFYRQAHLRSYDHLDGLGRDALLLAYADVKAAFEFYLENYNNGKPIILAGHSQGSTMLHLLLKDFFDGKELKKQLVVAYLPGIGVKNDEFKSIKLLTSPNEIGGFVSWNTHKKKINRKKYYKWHIGKAVVNPVTWAVNSAVRKDHKGFLYSNNKLYKASFNTNLIDGALWISLPHFPFRYLAFKMPDFHVGDVNLFWEDIRINAKLRALEFLNQK
jgi:hypothetical protein